MTRDKGPGKQTLSLQALERVDRKCIEFEASWNSGNPEPLEKFLQYSEGAERAKTLRELLLLDIDYRLRFSQCLSADEYVSRFPGDEEVISDVFSQLATEVLNETVAEREADSLSADTVPPVLESARFRVLRSHAKGGLGEVFVAHDRQLNRDVALKEIQARHAGNANRCARFVMEAQITGGLDHPGIVPVHSLGKHADGRPFYTMRFVSGDRLSDAIQAFHNPGATRTAAERSIEFRKLLTHFIDVCQTIQYAHSRGVWHRDLKPENILIGKFGETVVVDWGLAKAAANEGWTDTEESDRPLFDAATRGDSAATRAGAAMGTPAYMSPEQAAGETKAIDYRSDIYSLGATLYTILTGEPPFNVEEIPEVLPLVRRGEFAPPRKKQPHTHRALEAVCLRAMARNPGDRYPSVADLARDIEAWLADEPVSAYREPVKTRLGRLARRHQAALLAVVAIFLVLAAALGIGTALLGAKNRELVEINRRETVARQQSQQRFELAMDAIERYYTGVSEDVVLRKAPFSALRKKLLDESLAFYQKLRNDLADETDDESREALADALEAISAITRRTGKYEQAVRGQKEAMKIREQLSARDDNSARKKSTLADSCNKLGNLYYQQRQLQKARSMFERAQNLTVVAMRQHPRDDQFRSQLAECYNNLACVSEPEDACRFLRKAIDIHEELVKESPGDRDYLTNLAKHHGNLGQMLVDLNRAQEALPHSLRAVNIAAELAGQHQSYAAYQENLSSYYFNLANLYRRLDEDEKALETMSKAARIDERLAAEYAGVRDYQWSLLKRYNALGTMQKKCGKKEQALRTYDKAIAIGERLVAESPSVRDFAVVLGGVYCNEGNLMWDNGQIESAVVAFEKAIDQLVSVPQGEDRQGYGVQFLYNSYCSRARARSTLGDHSGAVGDWTQAITLGLPDAPSLHLRRALDSVLAGDYRAGVEEAMGALDGPRQPPSLLNAACVLSSASKVAGSDRELKAEIRDALADRYATQAVQLLQEVEQLGYFRQSAHARQFLSNQDFEPLQNRADFQKFIERVKPD